MMGERGHQQISYTGDIPQQEEAFFKYDNNYHNGGLEGSHFGEQDIVKSTGHSMATKSSRFRFEPEFDKLGIEDPVTQNKEIAFQDKVCLELWSLATRIQRNEGLEIKDRFVKGHTFEKVFVSVELLSWIIVNIKVSDEMAQLICDALWENGLIFHVAHPTQPFMGCKAALFQVADPYSINQLLLPSEMERLHAKMRSPLGPKLRDTVWRGKTLSHCVAGGALVDWLLVGHGLQDRMQATRVAQILLNHGYIYNISGIQQDNFIDDPLAFYQYREDYIEGLLISKRKMELIISRILKEGPIDAGKPVVKLSVGEFCARMVVVCEFVSLVKAKRILKLLIQSKLVRTCTETKGSTITSKGGMNNNPSASMKWGKALGKGEAIITNSWKTRVSKFDSLDGYIETDGNMLEILVDTPSLVVSEWKSGRRLSTPKEKTNDDGVIELLPEVTMQEKQKRAVKLHLTSQGQKRVYWKPGFQRNWYFNTLGKFVHCILVFTLFLALYNLAGVSFYRISDGIRGSLSHVEFQKVTTEYEFFNWTEIVKSRLVQNNNMSQFALMATPRIRFFKARKETCSATQKLAMSLSSMNFDDQVNECEVFSLRQYADWVRWFSNDDELEIEFEDCPVTGNSDILSSSSLMMENCSREELQNRIIHGGNGSLSHGRMEVVFFTPIANPPLIVQVQLTASFTIHSNIIQVHFFPIPKRNYFGLPNTTLLICLVFAVIDSLVDALKSKVTGISRTGFRISSLPFLEIVRFIAIIVAIVSARAYSSSLDESVRTGETNGDVMKSIHFLLFVSQTAFAIGFVASSILLPYRIDASDSSPLNRLKSLVRPIQKELSTLIVSAVFWLVVFSFALVMLLRNEGQEFVTLPVALFSVLRSVVADFPSKFYLHALDHGDRIVTTTGFVLHLMFVLFLVFIVFSSFIAVLVFGYKADRTKFESVSRERQKQMYSMGISMDTNALVTSLKPKLANNFRFKNQARKTLMKRKALDVLEQHYLDIQRRNSTRTEERISSVGWKNLGKLKGSFLSKSTNKIVPDKPNMTTKGFAAESTKSARNLSLRINSEKSM